MPTSPAPLGPSTVLGYPRIGPHRELKTALEAYWSGRATRDDLLAVGADLRRRAIERMAGLGLAGIPVNTFSYYDHVLDTAIMVGAVPERFRALAGDALDLAFAMARGTEDVAPLPMTKWFDTNYHCIVPEIGPETPLRLNSDQPADPVAAVTEAAALGQHAARPVLLGPVTFLLLAQAEPGSPRAFRPLHRLGDLLPVYAELLRRLHARGVAWVQLDEPALVEDRTDEELAAVAHAYDELGRTAARPALLVTTPYGHPGAALAMLAASPIEAVHLDLVRGRASMAQLRHDVLEHVDLGTKTVLAGVVSGRDVWRTDPAAALELLARIKTRTRDVVVGTSCTLLHVPHDLGLESTMEPSLRDRLAFADQKVVEVVDLAAQLAALAGRTVPDPATPAPIAPAPVVQAPAVPILVASENLAPPRSPAADRTAAQAASLRLPVLPTTTIGSFPQTGELRRARAAVARGTLTVADYDALVEAEIERAIRLQERLDLDVLVHGEPERNDMVQYFAEQLDGFATTEHGWVQSYGSRCTRPPILHGEVRRRKPMTLRWTRYAQSLTDRPVKGMLTGPVTIVAWSFVRRDVPLWTLVHQVAKAVRAELLDLEAAGTGIIQVDEPALRELLPLRRAEQEEYLAWAVAAYRLAATPRSDATQIHTHICYSDTGRVLAALAALDADVTTIECTRSGGRVLTEPALGAVDRGIGPGVYDIHSPRIPSPTEVTSALEAALAVIPADRLWVNPDCGLKTRTYEQVEAALATVVSATAAIRKTLE